jgi:hypothetical protein
MSRTLNRELMGNLITLPLVVKKNEYYLLIQINAQSDHSKLYVSVITDDSKSKIYNSFVFKSDGNKVVLVNTPPDSLSMEFLNQIVVTLEKYILNVQQFNNMNQ